MNDRALAELIDAVGAADGASDALDRRASTLLGGPPRAYTARFHDARASLPPGWGYIIEHPHPHLPYAEATRGATRVGSTGTTVELALLAAGLRAWQVQRAEANTPKEPARA